MKWRRRFLAAVAVAVVMAVPGCGGGNAPIPVEGVVTLDGKPVEGASVTFAPEGDVGQMAYGTTDSEGVFSLTTSSEKIGALAGTYKVLVSKTEVGSVPAVKEGADMRQVRRQLILESKKHPPKNLIPKVYGDARLTPLRWQVPADGKKTLELKSKGS